MSELRGCHAPDKKSTEEWARGTLADLTDANGRLLANAEVILAAALTAAQERGRQNGEVTTLERVADWQEKAGHTGNAAYFRSRAHTMSKGGSMSNPDPDKGAEEWAREVYFSLRQDRWSLDEAVARISRHITAAQASALERAAQLCETAECADSTPGPLFTAGWNHGVHDAAAAIRALRTKETPK